MKNLLKIFHLMTVVERKDFILMQALIVFMSLLEVLNMLLLGTFLGLVAVPNDGGLSRIETLFSLTWGINNRQDILVYLGIATIAVLILSSIISIITVWRISNFGVQLGSSFGNRLFNFYIAQKWLFHVGNNSNEYINRITSECGRIATGVIQPFMLLNAKVVLAIMIIGGLFSYDVRAASLGLAFFAAAYMIIYAILRSHVAKCGERVSIALGLRMRLLSEAFNGVKDVKLLSLENHFSTNFELQNDTLHNNLGLLQIYGQLPRYVMELLAFSFVIALATISIASGSAQMGDILPSLAVFGIAGLKLLPAFQQIYSSSTSIRGNISALSMIGDDLQSGRSLKGFASIRDPISGENVAPSIKFRNVGFVYPGALKPTLSGIDLDIAPNSTVGFIGRSGSGKSTIVDLLLGVLEPTEGVIEVDGVPLNNQSLRDWRQKLAYVPQRIHLSDTAVSKNVAFGISEEEINYDKVHYALSMVQLSEFVSGLPQGVNTEIGEGGIKLSGGQRQRIGIARALYRQFSVMILDEATSALDNLTERAVVGAMEKLNGNCTLVIVAHRLSTIVLCDLIYLVEGGKIIDHGSYADLSNRHPSFFGNIEEA